MTVRTAFLAFAFVSSAMLPASAAGDNVVLVAVSKVDLPSSLPGLCRLNTKVSQVWEGNAFHSGQALVLSVPCSAGNSYMAPADMAPADLFRGQGAHLFAVDVLRRSRQGLARIDDAGNLIWKPSGRFYGPWGVAAGYRVLDGALVPATPDRLKS